MSKFLISSINLSLVETRCWILLHRAYGVLSRGWSGLSFRASWRSFKEKRLKRLIEKVWLWFDWWMWIFADTGFELVLKLNPWIWRFEIWKSRHDPKLPEAKNLRWFDFKIFSNFVSSLWTLIAYLTFTEILITRRVSVTFDLSPCVKLILKQTNNKQRPKREKQHQKVNKTPSKNELKNRRRFKEICRWGLVERASELARFFMITFWMTDDYVTNFLSGGDFSSFNYVERRHVGGMKHRLVSFSVFVRRSSFSHHIKKNLKRAAFCGACLQTRIEINEDTISK